ncbi:MAG: MBL fold metallo-hydrolase [Oscillospiraceae bacterium]|nr:MBL fold metallo-hydrolase [Oscillospiraceae bacterium]
MVITFLGAAHEVTGSITLMEAVGKKFIIDCGMEQGLDMFVNQDLPVSPPELDFVLLTHAHVDHSGKLPLLVKNGFSGPIYSTKATRDLCKIMLLDCAHIQEAEAEYTNRKNKRSHKDPIEPIYDSKDVEQTMELFVPMPYETDFSPSEGITVSFTDMGHLLGSAAISVTMTENDVTKKMVFSGDVGNINQPIIRDPRHIAEADYLMIESTYGDRLHDQNPTGHVEALASIIQRAFDRGGNVVIPSFAVGRTQEILYFIREIKGREMVHGHDNFRVVVDSPLAAEATKVFQNCDTEYLDDAARDLIEIGINPLLFDGLELCVTSEESKSLNLDPEPKVIISASGMCDAGRIRHHLKHNLWRPESIICFVGYQAEGTLGRRLYDGEKNVKIFNEEISVEAEIALLPGTSGHADRNGLVNWLLGFTKRPEIVFVNHGDDTACMAFASYIKDNYGFRVSDPFSGTVFDLATCTFLNITTGNIVKQQKTSAFQNASEFRLLVRAVAELQEAIRTHSQLANKEFRFLRNQIEKLTKRIQS